MFDFSNAYNLIKKNVSECVQETFATLEKQYNVVVPDEVATDEKIENLANHMTQLVSKEYSKAHTTELYYSIMNIVDFLALHEVQQAEKETLIETLDTLLLFTGETIQDISDSNDCGFCNTWQQFIDEIADQHKQGLRSPIE